MIKFKKNTFKTIVLILVLCFQSTMFGCSKSKNESESASNNKFDIKTATNVAETYMKYLAKDDMENSKKFYSKDILKNFKSEENKNLRISGFNITETNEIGNSGLFKIKVSREDIKKPFTSLDEYSIKIAKEDNDYKVKETSNVVVKEAFVQGNNQLRLRIKSNVDTNLILNINDIPSFSVSKDDKANIGKIPVPKSNFGVINFSYSGESLVISTEDKDCFIAIVKLDETLAVQGEEDTGKGEEKADKQNGSAGNAKEKSIGKEITALDIIRNAKIEDAVFSPSEKFIVVQYKSPSIGKCIRIYKADGGDIIPFKFEEKYPMNKVDIIFSSYDKENLNYDVVPKVAGDKTVSDYLGKWQISLKDFKEKKM